MGIPLKIKVIGKMWLSTGLCLLILVTTSVTGQFMYGSYGVNEHKARRPKVCCDGECFDTTGIFKHLPEPECPVAEFWMYTRETGDKPVMISLKTSKQEILKRS